MSLFLPYLMVGESGGCSKWLTSVATHPDSGCDYFFFFDGSYK